MSAKQLPRQPVVTTPAWGTISAPMKPASAASEIIFLVEEAAEGGWTARALGESIFAQGEDKAALHANVRDALRAHFDDGDRPSVIRLHYVREEIIAA